jgi:menaquinol-cytochrome c reductase iron-sulfur subunit
MEPAPSSEKTTALESCCCGCGDRRGFLAQGVVLALGATAYAVPAVSGVLAALNPLRLKDATGVFLRITSLDTLPTDGLPRKFPVIAQRVDAWTRAVEPIGAVYLRRTGERAVEALQVVCPHAGCTVQLEEVTDSKTQQKALGFACPCHKAYFDVRGQRVQAVSPSPRAMDALEVKIEGSDVLVLFQNFKLGTADKVAVA